VAETQPSDGLSNSFVIRLAPEFAFPIGINDCWDALYWAGTNAASIKADTSLGFVIGGGSAGGNIAAVMAHVARDIPVLPPLTGQYLCVPAIMCLLPPSQIPEQYRAEYLSHPAVTPNQDPVLSFENQGDPAIGLRALLRPDTDSPLFIPFLYGMGEYSVDKGGKGHTGVPKAYFQVCGIDPLRDEALIYERVLREECGIPTKCDVYNGLCHYFWTNWPMMEVSKKFVEDTVKGMRWLLEGEK
jgi:acetyl esterase/lipase